MHLLLTFSVLFWVIDLANAEIFSLKISAHIFIIALLLGAFLSAVMASCVTFFTMK